MTTHAGPYLAVAAESAVNMEDMRARMALMVGMEGVEGWRVWGSGVKCMGGSSERDGSDSKMCSENHVKYSEVPRVFVVYGWSVVILVVVRIMYDCFFL